MDMSFANQALCVVYIAQLGAKLSAGVYDVPVDIDREVARLKRELAKVRALKMSERDEQVVVGGNLLRLISAKRAQPSAQRHIAVGAASGHEAFADPWAGEPFANRSSKHRRRVRVFASRPANVVGSARRAR